MLGYFSHPGEREGKVFVFPHLFAEVMQAYMDEHGVTERDLAHIPVQEYANARFNPCAQMSNVRITLEQAVRIDGINRYVVDGLPLKTYDCSQISDGYASLILATEEGLAKLGIPKSECVEIAGWGQATDPLRKAGRDVLRPAGAYRAMRAAYEMAGATPEDVNVAEVHDCFSVMGAIGTEVIGKAQPGRGAQYWVDGKARPDGECGINTSGGLIAKGHPIGATGIAMIGWSAPSVAGKSACRIAGEGPQAGRHVQHRRPHLRQRVHRCCGRRAKARVPLPLPSSPRASLDRRPTWRTPAAESRWFDRHTGSSRRQLGEL